MDINIPEGYVIDDDDFESDPLAGTVDPETGLTYATDDDVREAIAELTKAMLEYSEEHKRNMPQEEKDKIAKAFAEMDACNSEEEREAIFRKYFPDAEEPHFEEIEVPKF